MSFITDFSVQFDFEFGFALWHLSGHLHILKLSLLSQCICTTGGFLQFRVSYFGCFFLLSFVWYILYIFAHLRLSGHLMHLYHEFYGSLVDLRDLIEGEWKYK